MPLSATTRARYKRRQGQELNDGEARLLRDYYARYGRCKVGVHLDPEKAAAWRGQAASSGRSLSSWIEERVEQGLTGVDASLAEARAENRSLRDEIGVLRRGVGVVSTENSDLKEKIRSLEADLMESMAKLIRLQEGAQ